MGSAHISGTPRTGKRLLKIVSPLGQFGSKELQEHRSSVFTVPVKLPSSYSESNSLKPTESPPITGIHNIDFINKN